MRLTQRVRQAWQAFRNSSFDDWKKDWMNGEDVPSTPMSTDGDAAMKYTAVFACNRVLSETYASSPIMLYRDRGNGERERTRDLAVYDVLHHRPNEEMAAFSFHESSMTSVNLAGNAVSERLINRRGELVGLYPYAWQSVTIRRNKETRRLEYVIGDKIKTESRTLQRNQVFHLPGLSYDGVIGLSPISYAAQAIQLGMSYEKFGVKLYQNGAHATGAFVHPQGLEEEAFRRLKKELKQNYTGLGNAGTPMLLEDGLEFKPFTINPIDAQLLESKRFQIEDICRIYRVPLHLVQELSRSTNNNIEKQSLEFVMYTMLPVYKRAEQAMNSQLLTPDEREAGYYLEFKMDGLLRGDVKSRYDAYAVARQWGIMSINDIRKLENLNPIAGGDVYIQPLNMIDIEQAADYYQREVADAVEGG